jgi:hypothetical protein
VLTDNIVELLCYNQCRHEFGWTTVADNKYSQQQKEKVLKNDFSERVNFLHGLGLLSRDEQVFVSLAHSYRNESYHTGIVHDDIMYALAWHYHQIGCDLFARFRPRVVACTPKDEFSPVVVKHIGQDTFRLILDDDFGRVAQSIAAVRPQPAPSLPHSLADSLLRRIGKMEEAVTFPLEDNTFGDTEERLLRELQYHRDFGKGLPDPPQDPSDPAYAKAIEQRKQYMQQSWAPAIRRSPIERWKQRVQQLHAGNNNANALQNFGTLGRDMEEYEEIVFEAAEALEAHIQHQIDVARGK